VEKPAEGDHLEDMRIIVRWIFKRQCREKSAEWIDLSQNRDKWRAFVSAVTSPRVS
jgi:hypothetical protein